MSALGPGGKPVTRSEALMLSRGIRSRAQAALGPYLQRSGEWQMKARDPGEAFERAAEELGLAPEELVSKIDVGRSIAMGAVIELLSDVIHTCNERGLEWGEVLTHSVDMYRAQLAAMQKLLVYEVPDEERKSGPETTGIVAFEA